MVVEVDGAAIAPHLERLADVARRHGVRGPTELDVVIGMDRAACPRRAIEGLRGQWEQRALLLALEDEPGDLAGGAMTRVPAVPDTRPSRAPACRRGRASAPAEEVLADVGDPALHFRFPVAWRGTAGSTTKPRCCAYSWCAGKFTLGSRSGPSD